MIRIITTLKVLNSVIFRKATVIDNIHACVSRSHANVVTPPLAAFVIKSLREGVIFMEWKMASVTVLPKSTYLV